MGKDLSPTEIEDEYLKSFPTGSGKLASELWQDVVNLNYNWKIFLNTFRRGSEENMLLFKTCSSFFTVAANSILNSMMLEICKLTDHSNSQNRKKYENASIRRLLEYIDSSLNLEEKKVIYSKLQFIEKSTEPIRQHRDKLIAHQDLKIKLEMPNPSLPSITFDDLNNIIANISDLINELEKKYLNSSTAFDHFFDSSEIDYMFEIFRSHFDNKSN